MPAVSAVEAVELRAHPDGRVAVRGERPGWWRVHSPGGGTRLVAEFVVLHHESGFAPARVVLDLRAVTPCPRCGARETNGDPRVTCAGCGEERAA